MRCPRDQATSRPIVLRRLPKSRSAKCRTSVFENSLKCVCFFLIIALFDYHWTQILCEVEEQATCMPMSASCLSNSGHRKLFIFGPASVNH